MQHQWQVKESDAEKALQVLGQSPAEDTDPAENPEDRCPICHSAKIQYETFSLRAVFLSLLLLGFPLLFLKRKWKCKNCGWEWKDRPQQD